MKNSSNKTKKVFARFGPDLFDKAMHVADKKFEGNISLLIRRAVEEYVQNEAAEARKEAA